MSIIAGLLGLLFLLSVLAGIIFFAIFMARKIGLISSTEDHAGKPFLVSYLADFRILSQSLVFRFVMIAVLIGVMTIPLDKVNEVVRERSHLYQKVLNEIAGTWGHQQILQGPALFIPYTEKFTTVTVKTDKDGNERKINKIHYTKRTAIVLPDDLNISVRLQGKKRKRSLYESLVYTADVTINGTFKKPDLQHLSTHIDHISWDRAWLSLGISDTQAINKVSNLDWQDNGQHKQLDFEPGTKVIKNIASGFHAALDLSSKGSSESQPEAKESRYPFAMTINVNGSGGFYFRPFGKTTKVSMQSDWPHPSFQGNVLPGEHTINDDGFSADWSIPNLARNYPQLWTLETQSFNLDEFVAGVNLFESVSLYSQVTRAIKYGVLFFTLTYITFLIFELGIGRRLHVVQYGVIGLALSMFYLTLLSMAEHTGFFKAYVTAAAIIILMISFYGYAALKHIGRTLMITGLLSGLYAMLYSLLKLEDYALLAGTLLLLLILAVLMVLTRNIGNHTFQAE